MPDTADSAPSPPPKNGHHCRRNLRALRQGFQAHCNVQRLHVIQEVVALSKVWNFWKCIFWGFEAKQCNKFKLRGEISPTERNRNKKDISNDPPRLTKKQIKHFQLIALINIPSANKREVITWRALGSLCSEPLGFGKIKAGKHLRSTVFSGV